MGQAKTKGGHSYPSPLHALREKVVELTQVATLSYEHFLELIISLNKITDSLRDVNGKKLLFQIEHGTDTSVLWRGTGIINCYKVNSATGVQESQRQLNLRQFVYLYNEITRRAYCVSSSPEHHGDDDDKNDDDHGADDACCSGRTEQAIDASMVIAQMDMAFHCSDECVVCMDRKASVVLPCSHTYCEECIEKWHVDHKTCPICRAKTKGATDLWVLTDKPDTSEIVEDTTGYLMQLVDQNPGNDK